MLGEAATSAGYADQYTGLSGGAGVGAPQGIAATDYAKIADADGMVGWSSTTHALTAVDWQTLIVSGQLYLPPSGKLWLSGAYSNSYSDNVGQFGAAKSVFGHEIWWDAMLVGDLTPSTRLNVPSQAVAVHVALPSATHSRHSSSARTHRRRYCGSRSRQHGP